MEPTLSIGRVNDELRRVETEIDEVKLQLAQPLLPLDKELKLLDKVLKLRDEKLIFLDILRQREMASGIRAVSAPPEDIGTDD
ncbi:hypothetical protein EON65_23845 [archaeon]|nr:MAG: hypothetical protein EON65_23845 [archaeon]